MPLVLFLLRQNPSMAHPPEVTVLTQPFEEPPQLSEVQARPSMQLLPHQPQWLRLTEVSTQLPLHLAWPEGQGPGPPESNLGPSSATPGPSFLIPGPSLLIPGPSSLIPGPSFVVLPHHARNYRRLWLTAYYMNIRRTGPGPASGPSCAHLPSRYRRAPAPQPRRTGRG